jgi:RNA polymerase sigma factor (sigma-70 family)
MARPFSPCAGTHNTPRAPAWVNDLGARVKELRGYFLRRWRVSPEDAEDLAQETVLRALRHWRQVRCAEKADAWLRRIAHSVGIDHYHFLRKAPRLESLEDLDGLNLEPAHPNCDPAHAYLTRAETVAEKISRWRPLAEIWTKNQTAAVVILYRDGYKLTFQEIAVELGKTAGNCRVLYSRYRSRLQQSVRDAVSPPDQDV